MWTPQKRIVGPEKRKPGLQLGSCLRQKKKTDHFEMMPGFSSSLTYFRPFTRLYETLAVHQTGAVLMGHEGNSFLTGLESSLCM